MAIPEIGSMVRIHYVDDFDGIVLRVVPGGVGGDDPLYSVLLLEHGGLTTWYDIWTAEHLEILQ
jgi:hypothetical protein